MATTPVEVKQSVPANTPDSWQSLRTEMDRLFDRFSSGFGMPSLRRMFDMAPGPKLETTFAMHAPAVDIAEDGTSYKLTAELPGLSEKDVEVALSGDTLTIKGEKKQESEQKDKNFYLSERSYGLFQRSFYLPDGVDHEKIDASFNNGVLTVTLPKTPAAAREPRKIDVKTAA